jgi:hypothetical protein
MVGMESELKERMDILIARDGLGEWDNNFVHSLLEQFEKKGRLSEKQVEILAKIEARYTADAVMARIKWEDEYDEEKRGIAKACAIYYANTGYFRDLVNKVLYDKDSIPSEKQWNAMCCNKYAMKVREAYTGDPKFPAGTMIAVRKSTPGAGPVLSRYSKKVGTDLAIILSDSEPILSASRGNRRYKILFVGDSTPQFAEERDIKKLPKKYQKK